METPSRKAHARWGISAAAVLIGATTFVLSAQVPAGNQSPAPSGAGVQGAPAQPPAEPGAPPPGRGRRSGPEVLQGGPQANDPAYANLDFSRKAPVPALPPEEELKKFILQPGYRLELVLSDPIIQEPTAIAFDGNGRMFVLEDRGYMQDADATGETDPIGRISLHEDTDNDGVYDKHTIFVDKLIFPRFLLPFGPNAVLTKESHSQDVWKYTDTNGDGIADKKELFDTGYGRLGNVEHEESFLTYGLDNWLYSAVNAFRSRWTPHGVVKEPVGSNGAQWGVSQDDDGKMWFQGGASGLPAYWQFPILYGNFGGGRGESTMDPNLGILWGAPVRVADMQGGLSVTRMPDGSLWSPTGAAGGDVVRGHRLPKDLQGDYLYGEEVGRVVRRVHPENKEGLTTIRNYYEGNEFIKSTDNYFRPVDQTTAPDGTVYITDMYHGIIQQATWSGPGTYLRARIEQYDLDKVIHKGRIWRLVYDGVKRDRSDALDRDTTTPRMNDETPAQLVTHLGHPNGWWRDTAQQLLVLKQDKSIVPTLQSTLRSSSNLLEKFHVMWTLEGLGALDAATVRQQMEDREPRMRIQAIRASETLYKAGDKSFAADYKRLLQDPSVDVVIQSMLTMNKWKVPDAAAAIKTTADANKARGVQLVATNILNPNAAAGRGGFGGPGGRGGGPSYTAEQQKLIDKGGEIYNELCFSCHGNDGFGTEKVGMSTTMAPPLAGSPRVNGHRDYIIKAVLFGLTGPVDDKNYTEVMIPMGTNPDDWVASVASYVRTSFGNTAGIVTADDVKRVRADNSGRKTAWTVADLTASLPRPILADASSWKLTASHNPGAAPAALSLTGWSSQAPQAPGMWFQIELPQPTAVTEIQFESTGGGRGGGGGGRSGAGGRGVIAPGAPAQPGAAPQAAAAPGGAVQGPGAPGRGPGNGPPPNPGYPRAYKVETSLNGTTWTPVATGQGTGASTTITFKPAQAKFIKITQTASPENAPPLSITGLRIYEAARPAAK
jgi:mono/diheme cytochrome c family protein